MPCDETTTTGLSFYQNSVAGKRQRCDCWPSDGWQAQESAHISGFWRALQDLLERA